MKINKLKKIGIVITNWNSLKYTLDFIKAFNRFRSQGSNLVIVNNSPEDNQKLLKEKSQTVKIINTNKNLGYAGGLNQGIRQLLQDGKTDWFLLMNNDVKLTKKFFDDLLEVKDENTIYSPVILNVENDIVQNTGGKLVLHYGGAINLNKGSQFQEIVKIEPDFLSGCCLFMNRKVIEKVGELNELYESYYEDVDYSFRARKEGIKLEILWDTPLRHYHSMSTKNISGYKDFLITRNSLWFARRDLAFSRKQIFIFFAVVIGFFWVLPRPKNLPYYFNGVIKGLT